MLHTEISGIYNSASYFTLFIDFSYHSSCHKDQFTALILKLSFLEPDQFLFWDGREPWERGWNLMNPHELRAHPRCKNLLNSPVT